jgi:hypothetical protein
MGSRALLLPALALLQQTQPQALVVVLTDGDLADINRYSRALASQVLFIGVGHSRFNLLENVCRACEWDILPLSRLDNSL